MTNENRNLTPTQKRMVSVWEQHMAAEFQKKSLEATMATMTAEPVVNHVPVMTGGVGREQVAQVYGTFSSRTIHGIPKSVPSHEPSGMTVSSMKSFTSSPIILPCPGFFREFRLPGRR